MSINEIEFNPKSEVPDVLNSAQRRFSVDVLIYDTKTGERTVGWYDYLDEKWCILANENIKNFKWRYFVEAYDTPQKKKR